MHTWGVYHHPDASRRVVFLVDLIDRGPKMRVRWWLDARGRTYDELAFGKHVGAGTSRPDPEVAKSFPGHYWLRSDRPSIVEPRIACLDYSVAAGGFLTAYTWDGEQELRNDCFTFV